MVRIYSCLRRVLPLDVVVHTEGWARLAGAPSHVKGAMDESFWSLRGRRRFGAGNVAVMG